MRGRISRLWLGLLALALGAGLYWGRDVWGLWQFKQALDREAAQVAARGPQASAWAQACVGCHGFGGASLNPAYPRLAGQPAAYLEAQLRRFASGERRNPQMEPLAASLSEAQIHALAAYFSASEAGPPPGRAMFLLPQSRPAPPATAPSCRAAARRPAPAPWPRRAWPGSRRAIWRASCVPSAPATASIRPGRCRRSAAA
jgi:cytochrome c553